MKVLDEALEDPRAREPRPRKPSAARSRGVLGIAGKLITPEALALIVLAAAWQILPSIFHTTWFASLSETLQALKRLADDGELGSAVIGSLKALGIGYGVSIGIGLGLGLLMGRFRLVHAAFDVYVSAALMTPSLILAPVFFTIFGIGETTTVAVVVLYTAPIIVLNTEAGVQTTRADLTEMARCFGAPERTTLFKVRVPAGAPLILEGLRLGLGHAVKGMINGELFIALSGLGGLAAFYGHRLDMASLLAITLIVLVAAIVLDLCFGVLERRLTAWL